MSSALPPLQDADQLGRGVFSSGNRNRARRGIIDTNVFLEKETADSLSVDRLDHAPDEVMAEIGDRTASLRGRRFYGWATVSVAAASQDGRTVRATPRLDNVYHADIDLNVPLTDERRDLQIQHALSLANAANWRERPIQKEQRE